MIAVFLVLASGDARAQGPGSSGNRGVELKVPLLHKLSTRAALYSYDFNQWPFLFNMLHNLSKRAYALVEVVDTVVFNKQLQASDAGKMSEGLHDGVMSPLELWHEGIVRVADATQDAGHGVATGRTTIQHLVVEPERQDSDTLPNTAAKEYAICTLGHRKHFLVSEWNLAKFPSDGDLQSLLAPVCKASLFPQLLAGYHQIENVEIIPVATGAPMQPPIKPELLDSAKTRSISVPWNLFIVPVDLWTLVEVNEVNG